jgi:dephospho-CoA kinase
MVVIGLTGVPCVGKGMVKDYLFEWCAGHGVNAGHFSFSDEIKAEARARGGLDGVDRDQIHALVTEMRAREGPAVLAKRLIKRINAIPAAERAGVYIVEALRHPAEAAALKQAFGAKFVLIAVTADMDRIVDWMNARRRADESRAALGSRAAAMELLQKELNGNGVSVNVGACISIADYAIENNSTLDDLRARTLSLAEQLLAGLNKD